jgi:hypothetical protein
MDKISFSLMQLTLESTASGERYINPTMNDFSLLNDFYSYSSDKTYYEIKVKKEQQYIWFEFNFGNPSPRDESITNITTGEKKDNSRGENEVELLNQMFALFHYENQILYISDSRKHKLLTNFLKEKLSKDLFIKPFYKSSEQIISILKSVDSIKFTNVNNLFSQGSKERQALVDLTGTDAPEAFSIEAKYNNHKIKNFLQRLFTAKNNYEISNLVICGRDDKNFNFIYNVDTFSRKIDIDCCREEHSGKFDSKNVKENLLKFIENER